MGYRKCLRTLGGKNLEYIAKKSHGRYVRGGLITAQLDFQAAAPKHAKS